LESRPIGICPGVACVRINFENLPIVLALDKRFNFFFLGLARRKLFFDLYVG